MTHESGWTLSSPCSTDALSGGCLNPHCPHAVKVHPATGRAYITMGHPGFNLPRNNASGYDTSALARRAFRACLSPRGSVLRRK